MEKNENIFKYIIQIICDFRESFPNEFRNENILFNDHPKKESIDEIRELIIKLGYKCEIFGGVSEIIEAYHNKKKFTEQIFLNFSDGLNQPYSRVQVPMLLEMLDVPYSGSSTFTVALMNNKHYSKLAIKDLNILYPNGILITKNTSLTDSNLQKIKLPIIVKPNTEGSSIGITQDNVCHSLKEVYAKVKDLFREFDELLIEEYISGYEITNLIIGNENDIQLNEVILIKNQDNFIFNTEVLGIHEKAKKLNSKILAEEVLSDFTIKTIKENSSKVFSHLSARDIARIDYRVTKNGEIYFLEINSAPRISSTSEAGFICEKRKIDFKDFVQLYIEVVLRRMFSNHD